LPRKRPLSRAEIIELTEIPEQVWNATIRKLRESGKVVSRGEKRGTKWELATPGAVREPSSETAAVISQPQLDFDRNSGHEVPARPDGSDAASLASFVTRYGLKMSDGRAKGDPLYIHADDSRPEVVRQLRAWGFTYNHHTKKWWTRDPQTF
jgi:hypothetical protein